MPDIYVPRPLRKVDIGLISVVIVITTTVANAVWQTSQMRAAVDQQKEATAELRDASRDISRVMMDHEGRIRVLEDRSRRGIQ